MFLVTSAFAGIYTPGAAIPVPGHTELGIASSLVVDDPGPSATGHVVVRHALSDRLELGGTLGAVGDGLLVPGPGWVGALHARWVVVAGERVRVALYAVGGATGAELVGVYLAPGIAAEVGGDRVWVDASVPPILPGTFDGERVYTWPGFLASEAGLNLRVAGDHVARVGVAAAGPAVGWRWDGERWYAAGDVGAPALDAVAGRVEVGARF